MLTIKMVFHFLWELLLDIFFPPVCCSCKKIGHYICPKCYPLIEFCLSPLNLSLENNAIDEAYALTRYQFPIKEIISTFKYKGVKDIGIIVGRMVFETFALPQVDAIISVPLHPKKQAKRGFNQTEVIAKELSKLSNIPHLSLLQRVINTSPQAKQKSSQERKNNLLNAFKLSSKLKQIPNSVMIIDDVITTGTTCNECALLLKKHGVKKVIVFAIAHGQ